MDETSDRAVGMIALGDAPAPEGELGGLDVLTRHALALQAAGVDRLFLVGPGATDRAMALSHPKLQKPIEARPDWSAPDGSWALVVRAEDTYHRALPTELLRRARRLGASQAATDGGHRIVAFRGAPSPMLVDPAEPLPATVQQWAVERPLFVAPARTRGERRAALRLHLRSLIKPTSGIFERAYMRPLSLQMTRLLMGTPVSPNAVSWLTLALAFAAAVLVALPSRTAIVAGGLLHMFMRVVDCVDGELARLRYQSSEFGAWLDTIGDGIGLAAFIAGVTWQVVFVRADFDPWWWIGAGGVVSWLLVQTFQVRAALMTRAGGTFQTIEWGHRSGGERSLTERFTGAIEYFLRIDAISTYYGLAVIFDALRPLLLLHGVISLAAAFYFGLQLRSLGARRA